MKKNLLIIAGILILIAAVFGGNWVWKNFKGAGPAFKEPSEDITKLIPDSTSPNLPEAVNNTDFPLKVPRGFTISIFAKDLPGARVMAFDKMGTLWVSQTSQGVISSVSNDGSVHREFKGLSKPHGVAFDPADKDVLYFAEEDKISKTQLYGYDGGVEKVIDLPKGGRHFTRSLLFGPDGRLYVSIGSTCDVCNEKDERVASIYSMNKDGSDFKKVASGLRNSVFMATNPLTGKIWATEMGRDHLGDDLPPDEINIIDPGGGAHYGWPFCYGRSNWDHDFDGDNTNIGFWSDRKGSCENFQPSYIDLPAHSAPLGLAFIPVNAGWPKDYEGDLIVAFHGSWNRTTPTGYKLTRIKLDENGGYQGIEDFISGWLVSDAKTSLGRPVDILVLPGGIMYVSDDKAGVIYRINYLGNQNGNPDIILNNLFDNQPIASPFTVEGKVKGNWFFEGSFPIYILDENGKQISVTLAQTKENWMTSEMIGFSAVLNFDPGQAKRGEVVFHNDNPSGLPEMDKEFRVQVRLADKNVSPETGGCIVTGCGGQVCSEEEVITTCEYRAEYACYKTAKCVRQANGLCGWAPTEELLSCLQSKQN